MAIRVGICADFREERWPSMDRVAAMLYQHLQQSQGARVRASLLCPAFSRRFTRLPATATSRPSANADRFLNRFWDYPRSVSREAHDHDVFHIVDHSYAHLVHSLPAPRTVVTCHDLDAFRSILGPVRERRSAPFRAVTRAILSGLQRAACVTCDTAAIRDELAERGLVSADRLVVAPLGVHPVFTSEPDAAADREAARLVQLPPDAVEILHVGSTVPRKRIDVLLRICAALRTDIPGLRLIRVGDPLTVDQTRLADELGVSDRIVCFENIDERILAAMYRRAAIVLQPSDREGFGLPLIEAMASGTPLVASDLAVLREVGGSAIEYCAPGAVEHWRRSVANLLRERCHEPARWDARRSRAQLRAKQFTWKQFAASIADVYAAVVSRQSSVASPSRQSVVVSQ